MKKKAVTFITALALCAAMITTAHAAGAYITDPSRLRGSDYTDIPALASALDGVFAGSPALYGDITCRIPVEAGIGSSAVPPGRTLYVRDGRGNVYSGSSCYIYANAVYSSLFGDIPYHGDPGVWQNSQRVLKNASSASFALFASAGVKCGALLRTTANPDGSYNSNYGHSVIILKYDESGITYLEGNGNGKGLIRVTTRDWEGFNSVCLTGREYRICFIVQPTSTFYDALRDGKVPISSELVGYFSKSPHPGFLDVPDTAWFAAGVRTVCELGLMEGRGGGVFDPFGPITASEAVTMAARFLSGFYDDRHDFTGRGSWYEPYYSYCALWGIDTSFAQPASFVTRADFASLMERALPDIARTDAASLPSFPDVPSSAPFSSAVNALVRTGVIQGGDGLFRPYAALTRAEAACILARMADKSLR